MQKKHTSKKEIQKIVVTVTYEAGNEDLNIAMDFDPLLLRSDDEKFKDMTEGRRALQGMAGMLADAVVKRLEQ